MKNEAPATAPIRQATRESAQESAQQLTLLPTSSVSARFQLSRATRERGLRHIAEIRRMLAEHESARTADARTPADTIGNRRTAEIVELRPAPDRAA